MAGDSLDSAWRSPSNIAIVKYWGKLEGQLPANPSLSMTLEKACTQTRVEAVPAKGGGRTGSVNGDPDHPFKAKLDQLLRWLTEEVLQLRNFTFDITTSNSFPHSTGIASSASGLSAFTLCLLDIAAKAAGLNPGHDELMRMASFASRMGSGSACRSLFGGFTVWGETGLVPGSSGLFAVPVTGQIHPSLRNLHDAILVVSTVPKALPSSRGHSLMTTHPFAPARLEQAHGNLARCLSALAGGDAEKLAEVCENEALTLHSLIMTSGGGQVLMEPGTISIIKRIQYGRRSGLPLFFTLDAGPNVHVLYPESDRDPAEAFIRNELVPFCEHGQVIFDHCGAGPAPNGYHQP